MPFLLALLLANQPMDFPARTCSLSTSSPTLKPLLEECEYFKRFSCYFLDNNEYWDDGANSNIPAVFTSESAHLDYFLKKEGLHIVHSPFSHSTCSLVQERRGASKQDEAESVPKGRVSPHLGIATRIDSGECFILPGRLFSFSSIVPSRGFATNLKV
jgi:hypothetical protein